MNVGVTAAANGGEIRISFPTEASVPFMMHRGCTGAADSASSVRFPHDTIAFLSPIFGFQICAVPQAAPPFWHTPILGHPYSLAVFF